MTLETKIAKQISKLAGFDILRKTRQRDVIEARSLMFHILVKYHGVRPYAISRKIKVGGAPLNHATILHSLKHFDTYRRYNKSLDKWLDAITIDEKEDSPTNLKRNYIKSKVDYLLPEDVSSLANLVRDMFEEALLQDIKNRDEDN